MTLSREAIQIESYAENHEAELGLQHGDISTIKRGNFAPHGKRIRSCLFDWYLLWEQSGQTVPIPLGGEPVRRLE